MAEKRKQEVTTIPAKRSHLGMNLKNVKGLVARMPILSEFWERFPRWMFTNRSITPIPDMILGSCPPETHLWDFLRTNDTPFRIDSYWYNFPDNEEDDKTIRKAAEYLYLRYFREFQYLPTGPNDLLFDTDSDVYKTVEKQSAVFFVDEIQEKFGLDEIFKKYDDQYDFVGSTITLIHYTKK